MQAIDPIFLSVDLLQNDKYAGFYTEWKKFVQSFN